GPAAIILPSSMTTTPRWTGSPPSPPIKGPPTIPANIHARLCDQFEKLTGRKPRRSAKGRSIHGSTCLELYLQSRDRFVEVSSAQEPEDQMPQDRSTVTVFASV